METQEKRECHIPLAISLGKGIGGVDRVPDELWMEVRDIAQEAGIKTDRKSVV